MTLTEIVGWAWAILPWCFVPVAWVIVGLYYSRSERNELKAARAKHNRK